MFQLLIVAERGLCARYSTRTSSDGIKTVQFDILYCSETLASVRNFTESLWPFVKSHGGGNTKTRHGGPPYSLIA